MDMDPSHVKCTATRPKANKLGISTATATVRTSN